MKTVDNLFGVTVKSNGKYEPDHWYYTMIKEYKDYYDAFDINFNLAFISKDILKDGYEMVAPSGAFSNLDDYIESLTIAKHRWVDE